MNKKRLDEIRARAEADLVQEGSGNYLDQLEEYLDAYRQDIPDLLAYVEKLEAVLGSIASYGCCETPGCNINDPKCDVMFARAVLREDDNA